MNNDLVIFKGSRDGIYIYIKEGKFDDIKDELNDKMEGFGSFFDGGRVIDFKGKKLTEEQEKELKSLIEGKYNLQLANNKKSNPKYFEGIYEGMTKFIRSTIRSGQAIKYEGNVVVLGDINPGAIVKANGNIIVLGTLRGVAHAGYDGNKKASVAAFRLNPTQLRIANLIARSPDGEKYESDGPEIAHIEGNEVIIQAYLPKNNIFKEEV